MALRCPTEVHRQEWSLRLNSIQHGKTHQVLTKVNIGRLIALSLDSVDRGAWPFFVDGVTCLVNSVSVYTKNKKREREKRERRKMKEERRT